MIQYKPIDVISNMGMFGMALVHKASYHLRNLWIYINTWQYSKAMSQEEASPIQKWFPIDIVEKNANKEKGGFKKESPYSI